MKGSTNIAVAVRIRPLLNAELHAGHRAEKLIVDQEKQEVLYAAPPLTPSFFNEKFRQYKGFRFDHVFGLSSHQE